MDDSLVLSQNNTEIFRYDFGEAGIGIVSAVVELPRTIVEAIAQGNVVIEYRDAYGGKISASEVWLVIQ